MCGFAGFLSANALQGESAAVLARMSGAIVHRGPDDGGTWLDVAAGIALGHRRLSIVDLSPAGHQPMASTSGRYMLVFNGEIYNHRALRAELEAAGAAPGWRGHSDTEVLLAAIEHWGPEATLVRANGMFAVALWDRRDRRLLLARDRLGEKPLYYGAFGGTVLFGSELKALTVHPAFRREVNRDALSLYMRHNYVPAPHCIWRGCFKLPPAHYLWIAADGALGNPVAYWDFAAAAQAGAAAPLADGPDLTDRVEALLGDAVALRMEADVPLGAFLSGGIDSSLVVALMRQHATRPVRTFTIGFGESAFDEAVHARAVARHLGTDHTEIHVTAADARAVIPELPAIWDEPFSDSSQIPTLLVSRLARQHVTVALSGDGGDELFGGYNRYFLAKRLWNARARIPAPLRGLAAAALVSPGVGRAADAAMRLLPSRLRVRALGDRLPKVAQVLRADAPGALYHRFVSHWSPEEVVLHGREPATLLAGGYPDFADFRQTMMYLDTLTYLPGDILAKVDRASMATSLEVRVPLLDHRVVELAWALPLSAKFQGGHGKDILRRILYRHVPQAMIDRPKMGFGIPIEHWLTGPLRDWAEALLDPRRLAAEGYFDPAPITRMWTEHKAGKRRWHYHLWDVLMFQAWLEMQAPALAQAA